MIVTINNFFDVISIKIIELELILCFIPHSKKGIDSINFFFFFVFLISDFFELFMIQNYLFEVFYANPSANLCLYLYILKFWFNI